MCDIFALASNGPNFLKMIDQIWSIIDSLRKAITWKITGEKLIID